MNEFERSTEEITEYLTKYNASHNESFPVPTGEIVYQVAKPLYVQFTGVATNGDSVLWTILFSDNDHENPSDYYIRYRVLSHSSSALDMLREILVSGFNQVVLDQPLSKIMGKVTDSEGLAVIEWQEGTTLEDAIRAIYIAWKASQE